MHLRWCYCSLIDSFNRQRDRHRPVLNDCTGECACFVRQALERDYPVDQPDAECLVRIDHVAAEDQLQRTAAPDQPG
jgi:hypothetical protein